ncbi:uncharacterized protein F5147DRAFT_652829 [Suillus discolor]|uniref:Uncharacterized protein n=1 Tax=Suillus discolor TaxID=1912936 RepID=A0A9P7F8N6_9AGAM|nr:uncharacterized protein F5147DRAFT_652829 [Suillus discolor]KAG2108469.1 hypothetical protein F5147DRAFT_652829 [Suillus discolor]
MSHYHFYSTWLSQLYCIITAAKYIWQVSCPPFPPFQQFAFQDSTCTPCPAMQALERVSGLEASRFYASPVILAASVLGPVQARGVLMPLAPYLHSTAHSGQDSINAQCLTAESLSGSMSSQNQLYRTILEGVITKHTSLWLASSSSIFKVGAHLLSFKVVFTVFLEISTEDHDMVENMMVDHGMDSEALPYTAPPGEEGLEFSHAGGVGTDSWLGLQRLFLP